MSVEAITWALQQPITQSSTKFVLVVIANCAAGDTLLAYPSIQYLADATGQDRKTVVANLARLREVGLIEDTGERKGATGQVIVYRLRGPDLLADQRTQKRNGSENGTVPKTPRNRSVFPRKQVRKRTTEPSLTVRNRHHARTSARGTRATRLPDDWFPDEKLKAEARAQYPGVDLEAATTEFRRYWRAEPDPRGRKLEWPLVWLNRIAQLAPKQPKTPPAAPRSKPPPETPASRLRTHIEWLDEQLRLGRVPREEHETEMRKAREKLERLDVPREAFHA